MRTEERSKSVPGSSPSLRHAIVKAGLSPKKVGFVSSMSRHWKERSG